MNLKIKNKYNENLIGILEKNMHSNEMVIICHGSRGNKNAALQSYLGKELSKAYNTLRFDFSGNGESEGNIEDSTYSKEIDDLRSVVENLSKEYKIKAIIGYSKSGSQVLIDCKHLSKISEKLITIAPRINLCEASEFVLSKKYEKELRLNGYYTYKSKVEQKITNKFISDIKNIGDISEKSGEYSNVLLVHGENDSLISISKIEDFSEKFDIQFEKIKNIGHLFETQESRVILLKIIIKFLY